MDEPGFGMASTPDAPAFAKHQQQRDAPPRTAVNKLRMSSNKPVFSNSTNSLFINETPTAPDCKELTRSASKALASLIGDKADGLGKDGLFDERKHALTREAKMGVPSAEEIYKFVRRMYKRTRMQPECVVMLVSYVEKLLRSNGQRPVELTAVTWRRVVLAALVIGDKVFEDFAVWNADFVALFPLSDINDINALEREFLNMIEFATTFKASEYARYYFALRELSDQKDVLPAKPLSDSEARRLETASQAFQEKAATTKKEPSMLRSYSLSHFNPSDSSSYAQGPSSSNSSEHSKE